VDSGLYAACAGLVARTEALDIAANNLANVNTTGFRGQQETFREVLAGRSTSYYTPINRAVNSYGILGGSRADLSQGHLEPTGNDLDCGIEGDGFFRIRTSAGVLYTRNGNFHVAKGGTLVTAAGDAVLGEQGPIRLPDGVPSISGDGTISVNGALAGKFRLATFAPGTALQSAGNSYYGAGGAVEQPSQARTRQGSIESSNVNPVAAAAGLIALQRHAEMLQRALSMFHSEFNKIAVEDLPKV
jgi:flagellar basal-body rod protein FlgF